MGEAEVRVCSFERREVMNITIENLNELARYIAAYVMEERCRGRKAVTREMILEAISAYQGGAR
jgi:hypothetical protein